MNLSTFNNAGFERGAGRCKELAWLALRSFFFEHSVMPWYGLRRRILRTFGARLSPNVVIKPGVKITFPWRLTVGENSWLGEECWLLNLAPISIGKNVCISQRAFLCTGSHDWSKESFDLITRPITVEDNAWICANAFVAPGVTIGDGTVITAGSVVTKDMPSGMICSGNPCAPVKPR
jgi:putative colanic acid biosynthesis acetyltransferase WcaF